MKNRVNWGNGFSIGDVDTRKVSLKSYIPRLMRKASLLIPLRQTSISNGSWYIQEFVLEVRFSFLLKRGSQLPITARDRHLLLARF